MKSVGWVWALVVLSTFFWGSNFNAAHALAPSLQPLTAAAERFGIALLIFLLYRGLQPKAESLLHWRDFLILSVLGIFGVFGFNYAFFTALKTTSALNGALIMALSPMLTVLLSAWLLKTRLRIQHITGISLAFIGVCAVITDGKITHIRIAVGDIWMLGACTVWSIYSVSAKKYASHIPSLQFARWTVCIGAATLIAAALMIEQPLTSLPAAAIETHLILAYMGVCGSVLAYIFWLQGVQKLGPDQSAIAFNLVPVFTVLVNIALGIMPSQLQIIGMLVVIFGVLIFSGVHLNFFHSKSVVIKKFS